MGGSIMRLKALIALTIMLLVTGSFVHAETLTIATVNNGDMIRMQKLTDDFTSKNHPCLE
jgi:sorbitol/mannitol transport system substrate-binding protein